MGWFKGPPKEPGYYWMTRRGEGPIVVEAYLWNGAKYIRIPGSDEDEHEWSDKEMWCGPLNPPAIPTGLD